MRSLTIFLQLTKPRVMFLVMFSGLTALLLEGSLIGQPISAGLALLALYLTGGSANALNQYFERELDGKMSRTRNRRPLPLKRISPVSALIFSITIGVIGVAIFGLVFNFLTAILSLTTIVFYGFFYTLWLKPKTHLNIVIGGIAGAMAPVGIWAAATGTVALAPVLLSLIIFLWTPPHFWALALYCKDDYKAVRLPMLPVAKGDDSTYRQILIYSVFLFITSLLLFAVPGIGWIYLVAALILGGILLSNSYRAYKLKSRIINIKLFRFSLMYLFILFSVVILDGFL
ncbi:MAG: protoheme IX farnesyltransferase [candidate division Zixibacteria bacterium]|nr:protoheme IX farnesyltransferase [candidate division Zixibacteria bacterium]